uniref:Transmembrane protein 54b n=1 Tax=Sinocyclocheilus grahami TaxID=75366 RepID=A0A672SF57_SINGR
MVVPNNRLQDQKGLMKISMVLVGHVNFLLGALVHGVVLRHFSLQRGQAMESAISNVIAQWALFVSSAVAVLVAAASVIGLMVSLVKTIIHGDKRLLAYCSYSDGRSHLTIANECPFDPTRIFSTTIVLWVPLILMSAVDMVFSCRLFKVSISYLGLPWCLRKQHLQDETPLRIPVQPGGAGKVQYLDLIMKRTMALASFRDQVHFKHF